jgi:predicted PhzF superfamily epimerase YddE/YHI9
MNQLAKIDLGSTPLGVSVTAPGTRGFDFVSRFFGPWVGVDEDPATGMAHTVLGPYWMDELGSEALRAEQVSVRGGILRVRREGDRIHVSGQAVTVVRGMLSL